MIEVLPAVVEPLLSVFLTFPLDVAKGVLPIEGEVECVLRERARLPTYKRERNFLKSAQESSVIYERTEPFILFLIRVSKEGDLLIMREYQTERPFHPMQTIVLVGVPAGPRGNSTRRTAWFLIIFHRNSLLQIYRCRRFLRNIVERN